MVLSGPSACCEPSDLKSNITFINIFHAPPIGGFFDSLAKYLLKPGSEVIGRSLVGVWVVNGR